MNNDIIKNPWHTIKTNSYTTQYYKLKDGLFYFKRDHNLTRKLDDIDAYSNFWCLALCDIKDNQIGISRKGGTIFHKGPIGIFCPPFSLVNWQINPGNILWHGFISCEKFPETFPNDPFTFPWNKKLPTSLDEIYDMIKNQNKFFIVNKIETPSAVATKTKRFIDCHFNENLSILDISNSQKVSHLVMTRLFKKAFGLTPLDYRNKLRIFEAQKLFLINPSKVNKTSKLTGFNDQTTFYRHFKNSTLISPKKFSQN